MSGDGPPGDQTPPGPSSCHKRGPVSVVVLNVGLQSALPGFLSPQKKKKKENKRGAAVPLLDHCVILYNRDGSWDIQDTCSAQRQPPGREINPSLTHLLSAGLDKASPVTNGPTME